MPARARLLVAVPAVTRTLAVAVQVTPSPRVMVPDTVTIAPSTTKSEGSMASHTTGRFCTVPLWK